MSSILEAVAKVVPLRKEVPSDDEAVLKKLGDYAWMAQLPYPTDAGECKKILAVLAGVTAVPFEYAEYLEGVVERNGTTAPPSTPAAKQQAQQCPNAPARATHPGLNHHKKLPSLNDRLKQADIESSLADQLAAGRTFSQVCAASFFLFRQIYLGLVANGRGKGGQWRRARSGVRVGQERASAFSFDGARSCHGQADGDSGLVL